MRGLVVGDNFFDDPRATVSRATGAHRIASLFRYNNIEVEVIDFFNAWLSDELEKVLEAYNPDFIGLSFGLGPLNGGDPLKSNLVNNFIESAKKLNPNIKVIAGGSQVVYSKVKGIDLYFKGFAEGAIEDIIEYLSTGNYPESLKILPSLGNLNNVVDCNHHYSKFDLSKLKTTHTENDFLSCHENLTIEISRGCIFKCKFCNFPMIGKKKNDYIRTKEDIKEEILYNRNVHGISQYSIADDTFNDNPIKIDILHEISHEIDFELSFMCFARVDLLHAKPETLTKMMEFGVKAMFFGIESMNLETSKLIGKGFSGEKLKNYLYEIKSMYPDLNITGSFIMGLPKETITQCRENVLDLVDNKLIDSAPIFGLHIPREDNGMDASMFSKEWRRFGYEELTMEEIQEILEQPRYQYFKNLDINELLHSSVLWKKDGTHVFEVEVESAMLRQELTDKTTLGGWGCFAGTYNKTPLNKLLKLKRNQYDWEVVRKEVNDYIDSYKTKKMNAIINFQQLCKDIRF